MLDQAGIRMAHGRQIAIERLSGVNDNMGRPHYHNYYELYYLEAGARIHYKADRRYPMEAGEMIVYPPYTLHMSYAPKGVPFRRIVLYFSREMVADPQLEKELEQHGGLYRLDAKTRQILGVLFSMLMKEQEKEERYRELCSRELVNLILCMCVRTAPETDGAGGEALAEQNRMDQVMDYINSHFGEDISLETLGTKFSISTSYLSRSFQKYTGSTFTQYLNQTRISGAQRKILETDWNITEISEWCGFSSLTHFNRVFKSITGMTPSGYRKTHKNTMKSD